jgi:hypothetical protein
MEHKFDIEIATVYGLEEAILLNNLYFWISKNIANEKHFYDGHYWTYNSLAAFQKLFPYITKSKLERAIKNLKASGIIITGNYNETAYDRTTWYAITQKGMDIIKKHKIISENLTSISENPKWISKNLTPIPDIKPDIKPDCMHAEQNNFSKKENLEEFITNRDDLQPPEIINDDSVTLDTFKEYWGLTLLKPPPSQGYEEIFLIFERNWKLMRQQKKKQYSNDWRNYLRYWSTRQWELNKVGDTRLQDIPQKIVDNKIPLLQITCNKPQIKRLNTILTDNIKECVGEAVYYAWFGQTFIVDYDFNQNSDILEVNVYANTKNSIDTIKKHYWEKFKKAVKGALNKLFPDRLFCLDDLLVNLGLPPKGECVKIELFGL